MIRYYLEHLLKDPFTYWALGAFAGYRLRDKLPPWVKKAMVVMFVLSLIPIGVALNSCLMGFSSVKLDSKPTRLLAKIESVPTPRQTPPSVPFAALRRIHLEEAKRQTQQLKQEAVNAAKPYLDNEVGDFVVMVRDKDGKNLFDIHSFGYRQIVPSGTRKGPFCHITCLVHHNDTYDRETLPEFCKANWIDPTWDNVPGWDSLNDDFDTTVLRPGPAQNGFHSYKLYWK